MGSVLQISMRALPPQWILLLLFIPSIPALCDIDRDGPGRYCDNYAGVRRLTPAKYRAIMFKTRKIYQLCEDTFHTLSYNRVCRTFRPFWSCEELPYDATLGEQIKLWAENMENGWAENWIDRYEGVNISYNELPSIRATLDRLENVLNMTAMDLEYEILIAPIKTMIIPADRKHIQFLTSDQFQKAIDDLFCERWTDIRFSSEHPEILTIFNVKGVEQPLEEFEELLGETRMLVETSVYELIIKKVVEKINSTMQQLKPDANVHKLFLEMKEGKNAKLEHLFLRIYEAMQTDGFLRRLDSEVQDICFEIFCKRNVIPFARENWVLDEIEKTLRFLGKFVGQNNKLDMVRLLQEFQTTFPDRLKDIADNISWLFDEFLRQWMFGGQLISRAESLTLPGRCEEFLCEDFIFTEEEFLIRYYASQFFTFLPDYLYGSVQVLYKYVNGGGESD